MTPSDSAPTPLTKSPGGGQGASFIDTSNRLKKFDAFCSSGVFKDPKYGLRVKYVLSRPMHPDYIHVNYKMLSTANNQFNSNDWKSTEILMGNGQFSWIPIQILDICLTLYGNIR